MSGDDLGRPALVLAPHPDDETLGCGGLIATKRRLGARVTVVFMTDGAGSHPQLPRAELAAERRVEAIAACRVLGVEADCVHFLDIPDGQLTLSVDEGVARLEPIVEGLGEVQLVVPHAAEPPADHAVTPLVATRCAERMGRSFDTLQYPVWLWDQWPFTNPLSHPRARTSLPAVARTALRHRLGFGLARSLDVRVDVDDALDLKRAALTEHRTQMEHRDGDGSWLTLGEVAGGAWLDVLLRPTELYGRTTVGRASSTVRGASTARPSEPDPVAVSR